MFMNAGLMCCEWWRPPRGFPHFHTPPWSLAGPSAPTLPTEQSTFPKMFIFGSQWLRLSPPWPVGCVDTLLQSSWVKQARIFFMLSIIAKGRALQSFRNPGSDGTQILIGWESFYNWYVAITFSLKTSPKNSFFSKSRLTSFALLLR